MLNATSKAVAVLVLGLAGFAGAAAAELKIGFLSTERLTHGGFGPRFLGFSSARALCSAWRASMVAFDTVRSLRVSASNA
jgi:hypothetical protein